SCGIKKEHRITIENAGIVHLEFVAAANEGGHPRAIRVEIGFPYPILVGDGAGGGIPNCRRLRQDRFHPRVRGEWLAVQDAKGSEISQGDWVHRITRFMLDDMIYRLPKSVIRRANGVECLAGNIDELHRGRMGGLRERIDAKELLHTVNAWFRIAVLQKR